MVVGTSQEAETVRQDLERARPRHHAVELHALLENAKDQVLFLQAGGFLDAFGRSGFNQFRHIHLLQFSDVDVGIGFVGAFDRFADAALAEWGLGADEIRKLRESKAIA